jgi:hypothetical protein
VAPLTPLPRAARVINILKPWITENYVEYESSDLPLIQAFAQRLPDDVKKREARSLILALETRVRLGFSPLSSLPLHHLTQD